jgi:hypothetical protein
MPGTIDVYEPESDVSRSETIMETSDFRGVAVRDRAIRPREHEHHYFAAERLHGLAVQIRYDRAFCGSADSNCCRDGCDVCVHAEHYATFEAL